jgi:hypothetical protein
MKKEDVKIGGIVYIATVDHFKVTVNEYVVTRNLLCESDSLGLYNVIHKHNINSGSGPIIDACVSDGCFCNNQLHSTPRDAIEYLRAELENQLDLVNRAISSANGA